MICARVVSICTEGIIGKRIREQMQAGPGHIVPAVYIFLIGTEKSNGRAS